MVLIHVIHNASVKCDRMRSQKVRRRPESCHAYHPQVSVFFHNICSNCTSDPIINDFFFYRKTLMTAEELLLHLLQPLSSISVSPSLHSSPDVGQHCCFIHYHVKEIVETSRGFFYVSSYVHFSRGLLINILCGVCWFTPERDYI